MEGLKVRSFAVAGVLVACGLFLQAMPKAEIEGKDEKFMESLAPKQVGKFRFEPSFEDPQRSYKVDERTYELLQPFGVVGRVYSDGTQTFDVLLISGNDKNCFHDNRVCFQGQGFNITGQDIETVETPRGKIPVTFLTLQHPERGNLIAAMFFKGPRDEWFSLPQPLTWAMFKEQLRLGKNLDSTFYRIIPGGGNTNRDALKKFLSDYVVEAEKSSNGFF